MTNKIMGASFVALLGMSSMPLYAQQNPTLILNDSSYNAGQTIRGEISNVAGTSWVGVGERPLYIWYEWTQLHQYSVFATGTPTSCVPWKAADNTPITFKYDSARGKATLSAKVPDGLWTGMVKIVLATNQHCAGATTPSGYQILSPGENPLGNPSYDQNLSITEPKIGSYSLLANYEGTQFVGYTRIEIEGPCGIRPGHLNHGMSFKMTKSAGRAYWAGGAVNMRFCASRKTQDQTGGPTFLAATGMYSYAYPDDAVVRDSKVLFADNLDTLSVTYEGAPLAPGEALCTGAPGEPGCESGNANYRGHRELTTEVDIRRAKKSPAALNGLTTNEKFINFDLGTIYTGGQKASNAGFYALLPTWQDTLPMSVYRVPAPQLPGWTRPGLPIVNQEFSAFPSDINDFSRVDWMGVWRLEALLPGENETYPGGREFTSMPSGGQPVLRTRYLEHGQYNVTEDWVWRNNGLITRISQWWPSGSGGTLETGTDGKRCWKEPTNRTAPASAEQYQEWCLKGVTAEGTNPDIEAMEPARDTRAVEVFLADGSALTATLSGGTPKSVVLQSGATASGTEIVRGASYTVSLKQNSGQGYSGFLEIMLENGSKSIWRDVNYRPIYFHRGVAVIPAAAYGGFTGQLIFKVRPYWNATVNAFTPQTASPVPQNGNSGGAWSSFALISIL